jgi:methionyl-tRNA formyltransferase
MFHGEKSVGLTIHYMTEKIDDGMVLFQDRLEIEPAETLDHLIRRSKRRAAHCLGRVLRELVNGTATPTPLDKENGTYFSFPSRQQIREFHRRGLRAI